MLTVETVASQEEVLFDFSIAAKDAPHFKLTRDNASRYTLFVNNKHLLTLSTEIGTDIEAISEGLKYAGEVYSWIRTAREEIDEANKKIVEAKEKLARYLPSDEVV